MAAGGAAMHQSRKHSEGRSISASTAPGTSAATQTKHANMVDQLPIASVTNYHIPLNN